MTASFNLVHEPWIPCLRDGRREELGLLDTLLHAHEIEEVRDDSPLVTLALHRLLLAVVHRVHGPPALKEWASLCRQQSLREGTIGEYLLGWASRFDLFDQKHPFYQDASLREDGLEGASLAWLRPEMAKGANATLFDHPDMGVMPEFTPSDAARHLVATQFFSPGGFGPRRIRLQSTPGAKSARFLLKGRRLFETICLNLIVYRQGSPIPSVGQDQPAWERDEYVEEPLPRGWLDYLTWQPRRLLLVPEQHGAKTTVRAVIMDEGRRLDQQVPLRDPQSAYLVQNGEERPTLIREGRALWRDSSTYLPNGPARVPAAISQIANAARLASPPVPDITVVQAFGVVMNKADIDLWRHEELPLPVSILKDEDLEQGARNAVRIAEDAAMCLRKALNPLVRASLGIADGDKQKKKRLRAEEYRRRTIDRYERGFWSPLEPLYRSLLLHMSETSDVDAPTATWAAQIRQVTRHVFHQAVRAYDHDPEMLRLVYGGTSDRWSAERTLNVGLAEILKPYKIENKETAHEPA